MEVAILGAIDTAASDFTSDICKKNTNSMSQEQRSILASSDPGPVPHLHVRWDTRVTEVHSFHRASAVVAVVVTARALSCVHRQGDPTVQVFIGPGGHMRVGQFARDLQAVRKHPTQTMALDVTLKCVDINR